MQFKTKNGFSVEIADFRTRKLDKEYQNTITRGSTVGMDGNPNFSLENIQEANEILVKGMTGLSQKEIDEMHADDFNEILGKITEEDQKKSLTKKS